MNDKQIEFLDGCWKHILSIGFSVISILLILCIFVYFSFFKDDDTSSNNNSNVVLGDSYCEELEIKIYDLESELEWYKKYYNVHHSLTNTTNTK